MGIFDRVNANIKYNRSLRLEGKYNCIPWTLDRLSTIIPGVEKGRFTVLSANSKVGKTKLTDFLYVMQPFEFVQENPDTKLKIFYFTLEINKDEKVKQVLSYKLFKDKGLIIDSGDIESKFKNYILTEDIEKYVDEYKPYFDEFEKVVSYIDNIRHGFGIYSYMRDYAEKNGTYEYKDINIEGKNVRMIDKYIPNNPDEYVIVIIDHIGLISPERGKTLHETISKFSTDYCLKMRDRWNYSVVAVQQQMAAQEKQQFTITGQNIIDKLKPSADGLGDNKLTSRDADVVLGLFAPHRFKIKKYEGYDTLRLKDNFRELSILFNRHGRSSLTLPLYFNGASNYFAELPKADDMTDAIYESIRKGEYK